MAVNPTHRTPADWESEMRAFSPQSADYTELAQTVPELAVWRSDLDVEIVGEWESFIQAEGLAVPLEQCCEEGHLLEAAEHGHRLRGCPEQAREDLAFLLGQAPDDVTLFLAAYWSMLVQVTRKRRTGRYEWEPEPASGSPEVLSQLMFKWGPRHRRHRWTW